MTRDLLFAASRDDVVLKAAVVCVEQIDRHLHRVPIERPGEHLQMMRGIAVASEADVADLALLGEPRWPL